MANLVTQSLKILGKAVKETGKEYTSNLTSFINDAKDVKNTIMNAGTDAADTYAKLKRTNITKAIHDWFYQEEAESDSLLSNGNDEFDAGMDTDSPKLDGEKSVGGALTADSMINISNKQTNAIIKVGRRQTEQSVANTAEIVSSLNSRSAEMLTSLNNINKTLLGISSRLDKVIELQSVPLTNQTEVDKGGLYQDGKLSLMRIFEQSKNTMMTSGPMSYLLAGLDALRSGSLGPSALASIGMGFAAKKIQVNGKSFDDWGKAFNEIIGTATQTAMNEMINSKPFKRLFPGLTSFSADFDYGTAIGNSYDIKRAQFDGMTRMSIVNVIPEMLAKINESISGQEYHLDSRGKWIAGPRKNDFNEVTRASFASGGLNSKMTSRISDAGVQSIGKKIPTEDIKSASEVLTMSLVMALHKAGDRAFAVSRIRTELGAQVDRSAAVLALTGKGDEDYWAKVCQVVVMQLSAGALDSAGFVSNVNQSLQKMIEDAKNFAQSGKSNASQASRLTFEMAANQYLADRNAPTNTPNVQAVTNNNGTLASANGNIVDVSKTVGKFSTAQYVGGIFYLLNRGINVRVDKKGDSYEQVSLAQVRADVKPYVSDNTFGKMISQGLAGGGKNLDKTAENAVKNALGVGGDGKGFLSKFFDNPSMAFMTISNFFRGGNDGGAGGFVENMKNKARGFLGEDRYNAIADKLGNIKDNIQDKINHDDRFLAAQEAAKDKFDQFREGAANKIDEIGHSRIVNNTFYRADSARLMSAQNMLDHRESEDEEDKLRVSIIKGYFSMGDIEGAEEYANQITDKTMRSTVFDMIKIHKKRRDGQLAEQNGEQADIGSILITREDDDGKVGKNESQRSILGRMLGMVGRIAKGVAKLAARGAIDLTMGLKSMAQGLIGYKDIDADGNVHKNKGLIRNLTTVPLAAMGRGIKNGAKAIATGIHNATTDENGESIITKAIDGVRGVLNKIFDGIEGIGGWLKDKGSALLDKIKNSAVGKAASSVGSFLNKSKFVRGFTSGFKDAKAMREKLLGQKKRDEARSENPLQADQVDMIEGKKESIFSKMHDSVTSILEALNKQVDYTKMSYEENHEALEEEKKKEQNDQGNHGGSDNDIGDVLESSDQPRRRETAGHPGDTDATNRGGGALSVLGDIMGNIGKMMGGMTQSLVAIGEMVLSVVTTLESFDALKEMVQSILVDGLQPLNEAFDAIIESIRPLVDTLKGMVTNIAKVVVKIAKSLIDVVQPIIEAVQPIIETIIDFLKPILEIIEVLMNVIMVPIKIAMDVISPVIEGIGYTLQVVSGVLQIGLGAVMGLLGAIVGGLGIILSFMPGSVGDKGDELKATGESMLEMSKNMLKAGAEQIKQGIQGGISLIQRLLPGGKDGTEDEKETKDTSEDARKAQLANEFAAGNVPPTTINNNWSYTYGSGNTNTTMNQHTYGNYMNMAERGCGPVALADAYGRRNGGGVNPATLAAAMSGAGTYDPRRGTSVSSMLAAGNAMGMGMRAGGVTAASLSRSSPDNPITVLGSGQGFGTRRGNNHYVNVVGTDGHGSAYVSNPMTGRVDRQAMSNLVLNSKLGLYGSGDENDLAEYGFSDDAYDSLQKLKDITAKLTGMFTGESKAEKKINDANAKQKAAEIKRTLGDDYDAIEQQAISELRNRYPNYTDAQIQKKLNSREGWNLIIQYGGGAAVDLYNSNATLMKKGMSDVLDGYSNVTDRIKAMTTASQDNAANSITGAEMTPFDPVNFTEPYLNMETVKFDDGTSLQSAEGIGDHDSSGKQVKGYYGSPVHDFFNSNLVRNTYGSNLVYSSNGWYEKYYGPQTKEGVGSSGNAHEGVVLGVDFRKGNSKMGLPAITGGTVTYVTRDTDSRGLGKSVKWRDSGGVYHWYMHLGDIPLDIKEGMEIEPGQILGYVSKGGNTGAGEEYVNPMFRYVVTTAGPQGNTGDPGHINPFTYWQFKAKSEGLFGDSDKEMIFNYFTDHFGFSPAAAAGIMGVLGCEGMLEPEPYAPQMEGYFGEGKDEMSKRYKTLQSMNDYAVNTLFPGYDRNGTYYSQSNYMSDGLYLPGIGIAQWTADRNRGLFNYAKGQGKEWYDLQTQLDYIEAEKAETFDSMFKQIGSASSPTKAADIWMSQFEAGYPGVTDPYQTWLAKSDGAIEARRNKAEQIYKEAMSNFINKDHSAGSTGGVRAGKFIGRITNPDAFVGNTDDIVKSASEVFSAYYDADGNYYLDGRDWGTLTLDNGTQITHLRPDCSGMMSAVIKNMGYTINGRNDSTGFDTYSVIGAVSNNTIYKNGAPSSDWKFMNYNGKLEPGDIMIAPNHTGMYITGNNDKSWGNRGFDGGATDGIENSALAGKAYLSGDSSWKDKLAWTISDADVADDKITTILRYTGKSANKLFTDSSAGGLTYSTGTSKNAAITATEKLIKSGKIEGNDMANVYPKGIKEALGMDTKTTWAVGPTTNPMSASSLNIIGPQNIVTEEKPAKSSGGGFKLNEPSNIITANDDPNTSKTKKSSSSSRDTTGLIRDTLPEYDENGNKRNWFERHMPILFGGGDIQPVDQNYIPPLDMSKLTEDDSYLKLKGMNDTFGIKTDESRTMDMLHKMSQMTFNVRAQRVEELLEILISKVDTSGTSKDQPLPNLFDEGIPEAVTRLSLG